MNLKTLAAAIITLGAAAAANAAGVPFKLPTVNGYAVNLPGAAILPMSLPTVNAVAAPMSLPVLPAAAIGRAQLPSVPSPLPLPAPMVLGVVEHFVIDWSLLDGKAGGESASALVTVDPGPRPLSPASGAKLFDGRRESRREMALPGDKFF